VVKTAPSKRGTLPLTQPRRGALLAVGTFLAMILHFLGSLDARTIVYLPDVDTTILASFGLGHGAYLTKKAVGNLWDT
jgi:hypothetical protein